ncbi:MAG: thiolase family protein [Patescibacteria group bacterium]
MKKTVIVSAVRTAIGNFQGKISAIQATELGAIVIAETVKRANLNKNFVDEVIMGNVLPAGLGQNPARQAMLRAGLAVETGAMTINKVCGSGLMAIMLAHSRIVSGESDIIVAGGMENMSLASYRDMINDGLWDIVNNCPMGSLAELVAEKYGITRKEADQFALNSYQKALRAITEGKFKEEIIPVGDFDKDEVPRETNFEALAGLKPVFKKAGQVTAGNASKISDGAAAVLLMSEEKAEKFDIKPLASIIVQGTAGIDPKYLLIAPILSIPKTLKKAKLQEKDIDLHEINEAFSVSTAAVIKELGINESKVNIRGGAIALGHPIGASGARILVTLLSAMRDRNVKRGMASVCLGGGEAVSLIIERR